VTSSSPHTTIMGDGRVQFNDADANATLVGNNTVVFRQERLYPFNPEDLHWTIHYDPATPTVGEVDGVIDGWANFSTNELRVFKKDAFGSFYRFSTKGEAKQPFTLRLSRSVEPSSGLSFSKDVNGLEFQTNQNNHIHERTDELIIAEQPGEYVVTTTATVVETGQSFTATAKVRVYGEDEPMLGFSMDLRRLLAEDSSSEQTVLVGIGGSENTLTQISSVKLRQQESGENIDLNFVSSKSTDRVGLYSLKYEGTLFVDTSQADRCFSYVVVAETNQGEAVSDPEKVCITGFPIGYNRAKRNAVSEPITGRIFANNLLLIRFREGTTEQRMREIASAVDGEIIGQSSPYYQLELHFAVPLFQNLDEIMDQLRAFPEVERVGADMKTGLLFSSPVSNDPLFQGGYQPNLERVRADEAWFVTQGSDELTHQIAVIDSGISFQHEELDGRVINGLNFVGSGDGSEDTYYHGTHVAGIIAANTGNGLGMAGIVPKNYLQAVKITEERNMWYGDLADAIKWSANLDADSPSHTPAPIINISAGVPENPTGDQIAACEAYKSTYHRDGPCDAQAAKDQICNAVTEATNHNSLVVAAAGNAAANAKMFPAACSQAIAVGATELYSNERWVEIGDPNTSFADRLFWLFGDIYSFFGFEKVPESIGVIGGSNYGDWVALAAPGNDVYSTVPANKEGRRCAYGGNYDCANGTSQAAPHVSGALAQVLAQHPKWLGNRKLLQKAVERTLITAKPLSDDGLGEGLLNIFDAVFNGDFELPDDSGEEINENRLAEWQHWEENDIHLHCKGVPFFGEITPPKGENMLSCGTHGVDENTFFPSVGTNIRNIIDIPEGVTELPLSFRWKVASVDLNFSRQPVIWNDQIYVKLSRVDDPSQEMILFATSLNHIMGQRNLSSVVQISPFVQTDWIMDSFSHPIPYGAGKYVSAI
jgi:subtilisin family serine protease